MPGPGSNAARAKPDIDQEKPERQTGHDGSEPSQFQSQVCLTMLRYAAFAVALRRQALAVCTTFS